MTRPLASRGRFIVFEGLDGAGTTTQTRMLGQTLTDLGLRVEVTKEPSNGPIGAALRQAVEGRVTLHPTSMALAFAADRADHIFNTFNGVEKTLAGGAWVLCDRYVMSSLAYQSSGTVSSAWLRDINAFALEPDATLFVDTSPEICMERLTLRSFNQDLYHELGELQSVMKRYQQVLSAGGLLGPLLTVNGSEPPDQVHAEVMLKLGPYLNSWQETSQDATPTGA